MAYNFVRASSQRLTTASTPVTAAPFTMSALTYLTDAPTDQYRCAVAVQRSSGLAYERWLVQAQSLTKYAFYCSGQNPSVEGTSESAANSVEAAVWKHLGGIAASSTSRTLYVAGAAQTESTTSVVPANINGISVGGHWNANAWASLMNGNVAEVAIWNVELTAAEMSSLAKGFKPSRVRPQSLVFYAPLIRTLQDVSKGGRAITNTNTATVADHPRVY